jgi:hypothetical protein
MLPAATLKEIARLACTAPKRLSMRRSSNAGKTADVSGFSTTGRTVEDGGGESENKSTKVNQRSRCDRSETQNPKPP